jgi:hypothetical protein
MDVNGVFRLLMIADRVGPEFLADRELAAKIVTRDFDSPEFNEARQIHNARPYSLSGTLRATLYCPSPRVLARLPYHSGCLKGEPSMKTFTSIFAVTLALAFTVPAFGGNTETKEQCEKDGGTWDAKTKHCSGKY